MVLLDGLDLIHIAARIAVVEPARDILVQRRVVVLERQHIVGLVLDDGLCHRLLAAHRVDRDDRASELQLGQQIGNRIDFVGLVRHRLHAQHQARLRGKRAHQMHRGLLPVPTAPQALAIERDLLPRQSRQGLLHPLTKGTRKRLAVDASHHVAQGVVRRNAMG